MIIGIGVDLVDMGRIDRLLQMFGNHFIQRIFTQEEQAYASQSPHPLRAYTNRFAAKEAAAKALGTGIRHGIGWKDIEVIRLPSGAPQLVLHRKAYESLRSKLSPTYRECLHISFSDEPPYSTAFVVISAIECGSVSFPKG